MWARETVKTVPYLYEPHGIVADDLVWEIIDWALETTEGHHYAQIEPNAQPLCRPELSGLHKRDKKKPSLLEEAAWQHHYSYLYGLEMNNIGTHTGLCPPPGKDPRKDLGWCEKSLAETFCWKSE